MKVSFKRLALFWAFCMWGVAHSLMVATPAAASGFALYEWSARGNAMGSANYACVDDASAIAFNPAALVRLDAPNLVAGVSAIAPKANVEIGGTSTSTKDNIFMVPHVFYAQPVTDKVWVGIGEFTRFGLGTEYDSNWVGAAELYNAELQTTTIQPTIAFKFNDELSVGVGLELLRGRIDIGRTVAGQDWKLYADGWAVGMNLSALYQFNEEWAIAAIYHSPMTMVGKGRSSTNLPGFGGTMAMAADLPSSATVALSYQPTPDWTFEADVIWTRWENYDKLTYRFDNVLGTVDSMRYWQNTWRFQLGAEWQALDWMALRGGFTWDQSPIRKGYEDYMVPANDRMMFSGGMGFNWNDFTLDLSYNYLVAKDRKDFVHNGALTSFVDNTTHIVGCTLGYEF